MPISNSHNDLFHNSGTLEKINLFQTLLDSQDLTSMEALALLNTIHKELESPQGHDRAVYIQYAQMMERFERKMPELHKEVVRKWSELQYILKSREPKKENDPEIFDVNADEGKKSPQAYKTHPQNPSAKVTGSIPLKPTSSHKDFELEYQEEVGGVEAEEEAEEKEDKEIEAGKEAEVEEEKESEETETEEEAEKGGEEETEKEEEESEEKEEKEETETEENKEEESEEKQSEEEEEKEEKEEETEKEEVEEKDEEESKNNEREEEAGGEAEQKEIAEEVEEPDRMAVEAAEAQHAASEIEPAEEMELHESEPLIDEEEPPMEASG